MMHRRAAYQQHWTEGVSEREAKSMPNRMLKAPFGVNCVSNIHIPRNGYLGSHGGARYDSEEAAAVAIQCDREVWRHQRRARYDSEEAAAVAIQCDREVWRHQRQSKVHWGVWCCHHHLYYLEPDTIKRWRGRHVVVMSILHCRGEAARAPEASWGVHCNCHRSCGCPQVLEVGLIYKEQSPSLNYRWTKQIVLRWPVRCLFPINKMWNLWNHSRPLEVFLVFKKWF
jgi:hypothetical protein